MAEGKHNKIWGPESALHYSPGMSVVQNKTTAGLRDGSLLLLL